MVPRKRGAKVSEKELNEWKDFIRFYWFPSVVVGGWDEAFGKSMQLLRVTDACGLMLWKNRCTCGDAYIIFTPPNTNFYLHAATEIPFQPTDSVPVKVTLLSYTTAPKETGIIVFAFWRLPLGLTTADHRPPSHSIPASSPNNNTINNNNNRNLDLYSTFQGTQGRFTQA